MNFSPTCEEFVGRYTAPIAQSAWLWGFPQARNRKGTVSNLLPQKLNSWFESNLQCVLLWYRHMIGVSNNAISFWPKSHGPYESYAKLPQSSNVEFTHRNRKSLTCARIFVPMTTARWSPRQCRCPLPGNSKCVLEQCSSELWIMDDWLKVEVKWRTKPQLCPTSTQLPSTSMLDKAWLAAT